MNTDFDVIIAGGGPAGSVAAYDVASRGLRVLVLEKSVFPRYKVCGAGLTPKIIREIPFSIDPVIETTIYSVRFSCGFREVFTRTADVPVMFCTMRDTLDLFMIDVAKSAGASIEYGKQVVGYEEHSDFIKVITKEGHYSASLLIGADGASSIVARLSGLNTHIARGLAWEAELEVPKEEFQRFERTVFLDWGTFPGGYGWVFPKNDHISAGVGGPARLSRHMRGYYDDFIRSFGAQQYPIRSMKSWPIPVCTKKGHFHRGRVLLTGDAAGLTDSMTGEGIYYAVKSGRVAADSALEFLGGNPGSLVAYSSRINDEIMQELLRATEIKAVFNTVPLKIHRLVRDNERVWRAFGKILRGERTYADVPRGLGRYQFLWKILSYVSMMIYRLKEFRMQDRDRS